MVGLHFHAYTDGGDHLPFLPIGCLAGSSLCSGRRMVDEGANHGGRYCVYVSIYKTGQLFK